MSGLYLERGEDRWITSGNVYLDDNGREWIVPVMLARLHAPDHLRLCGTWLLRFDPARATWRDPGTKPSPGRRPPVASVPVDVLAALREHLWAGTAHLGDPRQLDLFAERAA